LANRTNAGKEKQSDSHPAKPAAQEASEKGKAHGTNGAAQANGWQRSGGKKTNRKRAKSGPEQKFASGSKSQGEPLPANEADRKGG
jgi:hypothetical protein